ncbi:beta strand repeat-containing protein, partial [Methanobrevibacter curvatus]|uniref:beta strand repeat-containing protein n=1 Tax=Methanobrevibacter curvatus TaxID=49547 RepID=UPI0008298636
DLIYISGSNTTNTGYYNETNHVWYVGNISNGTTVTLNIVFRVNGTGNISNNLTVNSSENNTGNTTVNETLNSSKAINLSVVKVANVTGVLNGQLVNFTITVTNHGPDNASNVNITEVFGPDLIYISGSNTTNTGYYNETNHVWYVGNISNGTTVTLNIVFRVNGAGNISNNLTVNSSENNTGNTTVNETLNSSKAINLSVVKVANVTGVLNGQLVNFTITVTNHGPDNASNVNITEVFGPDLIYISGSNTTNTGYYNETNHVWYVGNISNGTTVTLNIVFRVNGAGNISNNLTVNSSENNTGNTTVNETLNSSKAINLTVVKVANVTGVLNGQLVNFTITVTNHGPDNASNVNINEVFGPDLLYISGSNTTNAGYYDETDHVWYVGNISNGTTVTLNIVFRVNGTGNISNNLTVDSSENNTGNTTVNETLNSSKAINLTVVKTVNVTGTALDGEFVTYTIVIFNYGSDNATNVTAVDLLDDRLIFINATGNGTYNNVTGLWVVGNISVNGNATLVIVAQLNGTGVIGNVVVNVTSNENNTGGNATNETTNVTVNGSVNLTLSKTVNVTKSILNGELVEYTLIIINHGPDIAHNVVAYDVLDPRLIFINATGNGTYDSSTGLWNAGTISLGGNATIVIIVQLNGTGNITNNITNLSAEENNTGENETQSNNSTIHVDPAINLSINKAVNLTNALDGQLVSYIITITNHGPDNATGVSLTDVLDYRLIYVSDNASGVKVGQTVSWTGITINTNKSYIIQLVVRLNGTGNIGNIVNVTGSDQNNTGDNSSNGNNSTVDTNASINLTISKVVNVTSALDGQLVSYIITITNHGPDNATGVSLTDVLDYRLIYVSDNASGVKVGQTLSWTGITINTNKSYIIQLVVRLNGTGNIGNIVNVTGSDQNNTGDNSSNGNNSSVDTNASINLTVSKTVNVTSALDGQLVSYIINITNHGPDNATGISLTDVLDYRLIYISDNASGVKVGQTLSWTGITINTNKSYIIQLIVRLNGTGNIKNIVNVTGSDQNNTGDNSSNGNNSSVDTNASINLTVSKTVNVTSALDVQLVSYIINITNHGPDNATGISLTDVLDYRLIYISDNASGVKVGQTLSWTG